MFWGGCKKPSFFFALNFVKSKTLLIIVKTKDKTMIELIHRAFNPKPQETKENVFIPRVKSTVRPEKEASFNEVFQNVRKQLNK